MEEQIEWQDFQKKELIVSGISEHIPISLTRDENYNIRFLITCDKKLYEQSSDTFIKRLKKSITNKYIDFIEAIEPMPSISIYKLVDLIIEQRNFNEVQNKISCSGIVRVVELQHNPCCLNESEFEIIWLLNSANDINYDQVFEREIREIKTYQWGDFCKDEYNDIRPAYLRAGIKLNYKQYVFLLGKLDVFTNLKTTFLQFNKKQFPSDQEVKELIRCLMYVFGMTFVFIGQTKYNKESLPIQNIYFSTMKNDVSNIFAENQTPLIPIRFNDNYNFGIDTTSLINKCLNGIVESNQEYDLFNNIYHINSARVQPCDVKIRSLAMVLDTICSCYFNDEKNSIIPNDVFSEFSGLVNLEIDILDITDDKKKILKSKVSNLNNQSQNQRNKIIFEKLGLEISPSEKKILDMRHIFVHGRKRNVKESISELNYNEMIKLSKVYYTLINRLVLKLIGLDVYLDYATEPALQKKIEIGQSENLN